MYLALGIFTAAKSSLSHARMNLLKTSSHGSLLADGQKIRGFRCMLGLTQLELAMKVDCSERLIRKMEKCERVSLKSLSLLLVFFSSQDVAVSLADLIVIQRNPIELARLWFREKFLEGNKSADEKWFAEEINLSNNTLLKLKMLEELAVAAGVIDDTAVHRGENVAIKFYVSRNETPSQDPIGSIWLQITDGKIKQLQVILDSQFAVGEDENTNLQHHHYINT